MIHMSKARRWIIILLSIIAIILVAVNLIDYSDTQIIAVNNNNEPSYKSDYSTMLVYTSKGTLSYILTAKHVEYFSEKRISWFTQPTLIIYDTNKIQQTWLIKSDSAKLTDNHILYLYNNVDIQATTTNDTQLRKITTNNARINLVTQDIASKGLITLYGTAFNSRGLRMHGNLRSKNAKLIEKVRTSYAIQNIQIRP